jgi:DNA-binding response OmpR family regulator
MKMLVAEDEPSIAMLYRRLLESEGHEVFLTGDGIECMLTYREHTLEQKNFFDVVILDYNMPKKDGLQCGIEISKTNPTQRILLVTANPIDLVKADNDLPNLQVIQKPFELDVLLAAINSRLT